MTDPKIGVAQFEQAPGPGDPLPALLDAWKRHQHLFAEAMARVERIDRQVLSTHTDPALIDEAYAASDHAVILAEMNAFGDEAKRLADLIRDSLATTIEGISAKLEWLEHRATESGENDLAEGAASLARSISRLLAGGPAGGPAGASDIPSRHSAKG